MFVRIHSMKALDLHLLCGKGLSSQATVTTYYTCIDSVLFGKQIMVSWANKPKWLLRVYYYSTAGSMSPLPQVLRERYRGCSKWPLCTQWFVPQLRNTEFRKLLQEPLANLTKLCLHWDISTWSGNKSAPWPLSRDRDTTPSFQSCLL